MCILLNKSVIVGKLGKLNYAVFIGLNNMLDYVKTHLVLQLPRILERDGRYCIMGDVRSTER